MKKQIAWAAALGTFFGCTLAPKYDRPATALSDHWKNGQKEVAAESVKYENWWDVFQDLRLAGFIREAIENNQDLIAAHERVEQARDLAKISRSKLFPQVNLSPGYSNQTVLSQLYGPGLPHNPFVTREHQLEYALPVTMTYEVDLWGKLRSAYSSAELNAKAKEEAYKAAMLVVTTELANAYFQVRILDAQIKVYEALIGTRKKNLELHASRFEGEINNFSPTTVSDQDLSTIESRYFQLREKRDVFENMIAVLLGKTPSEFRLEPMPLLDLPPQIPEGVPAAILLRRPDLAELERNMESINAFLGVVYAEYFPKIDLAAAVGWVAPLSKYFLTGLSRFWSIGANLTEVIFDAGARRYKVKLTWAQFRESVAIYRQRVLGAFQEVEDSLSNLQWVEKQMKSIGTAVKAAKVDTAIASDRYKFGVSSYLQVTEKQKQELENERLYLALLGLRYANTVQLIKALGGGW